MKSATRHMLLLAGLLCLWASAYSLGRADAHAGAMPHESASPADEARARAGRNAAATEAPGPGIAARGSNPDLPARMEAPGPATRNHARTRGLIAQAPPRPRARAG